MAARDTTGRVGRLVLVGAVGPEPAEPPAAPPPGRGPSPAALALLQHYTGPTMWDASLLHRLAAVRVPVLVVWGERDPVVPPAYGRAYADAFADARFTVVPGARHLPTSEAPAATFAVIDPFLGASAHG
ncbi:alpha/beta fold hydrolase [Quadrisphaera sp. DSM 44207]|uniref:alpha/beta fold hydrolase n=1 Tax=Quadrisphaera sp. DSM 44207 TaxID=1881057 RepID=UPI0008926F9F|nr:alpha/beta fold hydrolase [Quadrisphaera sp. DSM 44207]SDQ62533.1 Serine aminopeptidase, S33 [Quadrisphaera sp. DSM 44207]